jgi:hypothetical protein
MKLDARHDDDHVGLFFWMKREKGFEKIRGKNSGHVPKTIKLGVGDFYIRPIAM